MFKLPNEVLEDELASDDDDEDVSSDEEDDMDFVEYFVEGEEYDKFNVWKKKHASDRLFPDSVLPAGPYSGLVRFSISRDATGQLNIQFSLAN